MRRADDAFVGLSGQDKLCELAPRVASADAVVNLCGHHVIFRINRFLPARGAE